MNIEKKKVVGGTKLSSVAKATIATTFGMAPASLFIACGHPGSDFTIPEDDPIINPLTSSSTTENSDNDAFSSSSKYLDIPQSHEAISSEVFEALSFAAHPAANSSATIPASSAVQPANSSATQPSSSANAPTSAAQPLSSTTQVSSSTATPASSVGHPLSQSSEQSSSANQPESSAAAPTSSAVQPATSSAALPANSSATTQASSAAQPASSSSSNNGWNVYPQDNPCEGVPDGTRIENGFQVIICPIPSSTSGSSSGFQGFNMVTTFELDDVMV